jgi:hypothetical protein
VTKPKLGIVKFHLEYVVDLSNEEMVDHAKEAIHEDIMYMVKYNNVYNHISVEKSKFKKISDIPDFLKDLDKDDLV